MPSASAAALPTPRRPDSKRRRTERWRPGEPGEDLKCNGNNLVGALSSQATGGTTARMEARPAEVEAVGAEVKSHLPWAEERDGRAVAVVAVR